MAAQDALGFTFSGWVLEVLFIDMLKDGRPVSSGELMNLFANCGGATVQCAFSVNNYTGKTSIYDIGGHKE